MRPIGTTQSAIRMPLNRILGTEANVRILRLLSATTSAMGQAELARQTGLNPSGVGRALAGLEELGVVEFAGGGAGKAPILRRRGRLAEILQSLFASERARFDEVTRRLATICSQMPDPPLSAWIEGPVATGTDSVDDPVVFGLMVPVKSVEKALDALTPVVDALSEDLDMAIEVRAVTRADLEALGKQAIPSLQQVVSVFGPPPTLLLGRWTPVPPKKRHADLDADALARAEGVAELLKKDRTLVDRAQEYLERRMAGASPAERRDLAEWVRLLQVTSPVRIRRALVADTERGARLRQSMPFLEVLTPRERIQVAARRRARKK